MGLTSTAWVGAVAVGLGIAWMLWQMRENRTQRTEVPG
jgi:predicted MFS family arabinose efflux permease